MRWARRGHTRTSSSCSFVWYVARHTCFEVLISVGYRTATFDISFDNIYFEEYIYIEHKKVRNFDKDNDKTINDNEKNR